IRLARGFTGRDRIVKIEASYHGHHDALLVSVEPSPDLMGPADAPVSVPYSAGTPQAVVDLVTVVPFNDLAILERTLDRHRGEVAAIIVEPVMMNIGIVLPEDGYLAGIRDLAHQHGALLIFDEVKTGVTIAPGGATERFGVTPDLVALAKAIGGGLPCGAVGGRTDVMSVIEQKRVAQMGTFNGNPLTMAASRVTLLEILTPTAYAHFDALAETLQGGLDAVIAEHGLPFHVTTLAPRACLTYRKQPVPLAGERHHHRRSDRRRGLHRPVDGVVSIASEPRPGHHRDRAGHLRGWSERAQRWLRQRLVGRAPRPDQAVRHGAGGAGMPRAVGEHRRHR